MSWDKHLCPGTSRDKITFPKNKTGKRHSETENLVIFLFWNVLFLFFVFFWESDFVPGHPGTEEFVPGFLLLPLFRDKGTPGQENFFVLGRPVPWKRYLKPFKCAKL